MAEYVHPHPEWHVNGVSTVEVDTQFQGFHHLVLRVNFHGGNPIHIPLGMRMNISYHGRWLIDGQSKICLYYSSIDYLNKHIVEETENHLPEWNIYLDNYKIRGEKASK